MSVIQQSLGFRGRGYLPQSLAYFAAHSVQLDGARKTLIDNFIRALIACGAWSKLGALYIHTLVTEQQSLVDVVQRTAQTSPLTKTGTPTFTTKVGWTGANSNSHKLTTPGNVNHSDFKYASGDGSMGAYCRSQPAAGTDAIMGTADNRGAVFPERVAGSPAMITQANSSFVQGAATLPGLIHGGRSGGTHYGWKNKTALAAPIAVATVAPPASPLNILTNGNSWPNNGGVTALSYVGAFLPTTEMEGLSDAVNILIPGLDALP